MSDKNKIFSTVNSQEILQELDHAIGDHMTWLALWHRALLCHEPPSPRDLAYDPHHLCRFGSWYVKNQHKGLVNQPAIRNLAKLHRKMHDQARELMESARCGEPLPRKGYDAFMIAAKGFITRARRLESAFVQASSDLDPLTGLNNRKVMLREIDREYERMSRTKIPCCLVLSDIDHFKKVNDTYGHQAGDRVLISTADCFLAHMRPYDSLYRYGGEEFLFCLPNTSMEEALLTIERLRAQLENKAVILHSGEKLQVTASFGIALMVSEDTVEQTIEHADQAMYCSKNKGRNRVSGWDGPNDIDAI